MNNYTYIIRTPSEHVYMNIYNQVILKYSFPMSLNILNDLTEYEKSQVINNEYIFVKNLITQILGERVLSSESSSSKGILYNDNNIFIIPRILYDLFFIMYHGIHDIKPNIPRYSFNIELATYTSYCERTNEYHDSIFSEVYLLNEYILQQLDTIGYDYSSPDYIEYEKVARYILESMRLYSTVGVNENIIDIYENNFDEINSIINKNIHLIITEPRMLITRDTPTPNNVFSEMSFSKVVMSEMGQQSQQYSPRMLFFSSIIIVSIIQQRLAPIFKDISILDDVTIEEKVERAIGEFMNICENKEDVILVISNPEIYKYYPLYKFTRFLDEDLILQCVKIESVEGSGNQKNFILYRGSPDDIEGAANEEMFRRKKVYKEGYSVSYNTSLLNGYFSDTTACTYNYMIGDVIDDAYKHYYRMRKFKYGDDSDVSNLFFIPPLHPYLQLSSYGEFWHARSKIFIGSQIQWLSTFAGIFANTTGRVGYSENFPDYLVSHLKLKRNTIIDPGDVTQLAEANKINIMNKFNKFIKAHRYPIFPLRYNIQKNITRKTPTTVSKIKKINQLPVYKNNGELVSEKEIAQALRDIEDDTWHSEHALFGGRNKSSKNKRRTQKNKNKSVKKTKRFKKRRV